MLRKIAIAGAVLALVLTGCDKPADDNEVHINMPRASSTPPAMYAPPPAFVPPPDVVVETRSPGGNVLFSLQHDLTIAMPHDAVAARFQRLRDACLKDVKLHCTLISSSISATNGKASGQLHIALPHEQVGVFEKKLLEPLAQDGEAKPAITSRSTSSENQTEASADSGRALSQAKAYRDKLEELEKRPNLTVDEVIKIHAELREAQSAVDAAEAAKRAIDSHVVLEHVNIALEEVVVPVVTSPFTDFWTNARDVVSASTASMLLRLINLLPWLPVVFVLAWLATRFIGRVRIRRVPHE